MTTIESCKVCTYIAVFFAELVKRHAGVLGLGACVLSSPYDVPTWMPQLLMNLSAHLNDPQPIEVKFFLVSFFARMLLVMFCKKPFILVISYTLCIFCFDKATATSARARSIHQ